MFERIVCNLTANGTRFEQLEGKEYLVCPTVMIVEGVLNGSNGALYYPGSELQKTPEVWNMKPVIVYHPSDGASACTPIILNSRKIGLLLNTTWDAKANKLRTECWLDVERCKSVDDRIVNAIEDGKTIEVSTGLFTDAEMTEGEFKGKPYTAIARNYRPDHLAVLPDMTGACSVADGAGLLQLNQEKVLETEYNQAFERSMRIFNAMSFSNIHQRLNDLLRERYSDQQLDETWVEDVYPAFFIFRRNDSLFKLGYLSSDVEVTLSDAELQEVVRVTEYRTIDGDFVGNSADSDKLITNQQNEKGAAMDRKKIIADLIANDDSAFNESHQKFLEGLKDEELKGFSDTLQCNAKTEETGDGTEDKKPGEGKSKSKTEKELNTDPTPTEEKPSKNQRVSMEQFLASAPAELQEVLVSGLQTLNSERKRLIETITANENNAFTAEQLGKMDLETLKGIAAVAKQPEAPKLDLHALYVGSGAPVENRETNEDDEPLLMPSYNFESADK